MFSAGIIMNIVVAAPDNLSVNGRRETRLRLHNHVCHWLCSNFSDRHVIRQPGVYTTTASGVPFDTDPR